ncbi:subtilisin-like serine protease [Cordyceps javanica]|uniref:Subtilisin-like serine protease n=1 Tax=Cordyceps javanica TaxID=43265 RepID=A0A545VIN3_9HYPO|nr:subtilisin-like serine protease [Cordyceps javanica]TQW01588.1 subtilisin-like serine protease [Cordyceps javanica]
MATAQKKTGGGSQSPARSCAPFTVCLLDQEYSEKDPELGADRFKGLPATHRTRESEDLPGDNIVPPSANIVKFLRYELLVPRLNVVQGWLWMCGRPMPPRPLHHQLLLKRNITITENPELHLVWSKRRIFLKPVPEWLLDSAFWKDHIVGPAQDRCALDECARGFLFSYCALIAYKSDFRIARENELLPEELTWPVWKKLSMQILQNHAYKAVNPRYWYGELRLDRLNMVYMFRLGYFLRGYSSVDSAAVYMDLLHDNFGVLAALLAYVIVVLTAMQVGFGVDRLKDNGAFQSISYGFAIFSMISPLAGAFVIVVLLLPIFCGNWLETKKYKSRRYEAMGVDPQEKEREASSSV